MTDNVSVDVSDSGNYSKMTGSVIIKSSDWKSSNNLHDAARNHDHKMLLAILQGGNAEINSKDAELKTALHVLLEDGFLGHMNEDAMVKCLQILIDFNADVNCKDINEKTPLSLAVQNHFHQCTKILLDASAQCSAKLATNIAMSMPEILLENFDNGVSLVDKTKGDLTVKLDWRPILRLSEDTLGKQGFKYEQKETQFLYNLLDVNINTRKKILNHPLVEAFVHFKSSKMANRFRWFYFLSIIYPLLYGLFIYFLYFERCVIDKVDASNETEVSSTTLLTVSRKTKTKCTITAPITAASSLLLVVIALWGLVEIYMQLRVDRRYLTSWRTWVIRVTIIVMGVTLWPGLHYQDTYNITFQYPIASLGIFLAWVMFLIQMGLYERFSIYLEMLVKILMSVVKISLMFLPLFIGFYMGFNLMFDDMSGVFSFIMMTVDVGAVAYDNLIEDARESALWFEALAYTFCVGFVIVIVIVFMNFLLAVSIKDVDTLKGQARMAGKSRQIQNLFMVDLIDPNSAFVIKKNMTEDMWFYTYNPKSKKGLPEEIKMKITLLLKAKKVNSIKAATKNNENNMLLNLTHEPFNEMSKILMRRIEEIEMKLDLLDQVSQRVE